MENLRAVIITQSIENLAEEHFSLTGKHFRELVG